MILNCSDMFQIPFPFSNLKFSKRFPVIADGISHSLWIINQSGCILSIETTYLLLKLMFLAGKKSTHISSLLLERFQASSIHQVILWKTKKTL